MVETRNDVDDGTEKQLTRYQMHNHLGSAFNNLGKPAEWQREILRAFQSWASVTNANVALMADAGTKFGATGDLQADNRFGDIRIGGKKLSTGSLATAVQVVDSTGVG